MCAAAVDNDDGDEWRKKSKDTEEQPAEEHTEEVQDEAGEEEEDEATALKDESQPQSSAPLAWKYEDESAVVTVRTHAPGEDEEADDTQPPASSEQHAAGNGFAERFVRKSGDRQVSQKKAVVKAKKKDRKGPRKMMKSKKEKALGIKKKPRFRGR